MHNPLATYLKKHGVTQQYIVSDMGDMRLSDGENICPSDIKNIIVRRTLKIVVRRTNRISAHRDWEISPEKRHRNIQGAPLQLLFPSMMNLTT